MSRQRTEISNRKWSVAELQTVRQEILSKWPTGREVNLKEAFAYHRNMPSEKNAAAVMQRGKKEGRTLVQPRIGFPTVEEHAEALRYVQENSGYDIAPTQPDTNTRYYRFEDVQKALESSMETGKSKLNGYPIVNHGVYKTRRVVEAVKVPLCLRFAAPDARFSAEIALAAGYSAFISGAIGNVLCFSKRMTPEEGMLINQYSDRLAAHYYEEGGVPVYRELTAYLTGTLVPPSVCNSVMILEALLAAGQGVKYICPGYLQGGDLIQDVAAVRVLAKLTEEYLGRLGYEGVEVSTVFHQWLSAFPPDMARAFAVICWGAATAALAGANMVIAKSPVEFHGVPSKETNAAGARASKQTVEMLRYQRLPMSEELKTEMDVAEIETRAIVDRVIELGEGDLAIGVIRGIKAGVIDIPWAPNMHNAGLVMPVRDKDGRIRFLSHGNLPIPKDVLDFHRERIAARGKAEGREPSYEMLVDDVLAVPRGTLLGVAQV